MGERPCAFNTGCRGDRLIRAVNSVDREREPAPVRKRLSRGARRAQIIESAKAVWSRTGAHRTTVRDIANEAGVTENFVYQVFESREEVFQLAVLDPLDALVASLARRLRAVARGAESSPMGEVHRNLHRAFLADVVKMIPLMAAAQFADPIKGPRFYTGKLYPAVRRSILGLMRRLTGFDPESVEMDVVIRTLMGAHFSIALETVLSGEQLEVGQVAHDLTMIFRHGLKRGGALRDAKRSTLGSELSPGLVCRDMARDDALASGIHCGPNSPLPQRKQLARADRIEVIRAAARQVFLTHGLAGARSMQLARTAGISEAFLFRVFESKEHIYEAAVLEPLEAAFVKFAQHTSDLADANSSSRFLPKFVRIALPFFAENGPLCVSALYSELGEGQRYFRLVLLPYLRRIEAILAAKCGLSDAGVSPKTARRAIFGATWAISFDARRRLYPVDSNRVAMILIHLLLGKVPASPVSKR